MGRRAIALVLFPGLALTGLCQEVCQGDECAAVPEAGQQLMQSRSMLREANGSLKDDASPDDVDKIADMVPSTPDILSHDTVEMADGIPGKPSLADGLKLEIKDTGEMIDDIIKITKKETAAAIDAEVGATAEAGSKGQSKDSKSGNGDQSGGKESGGEEKSKSEDALGEMNPLATNLEFIVAKLSQLEATVEIQQQEINALQKTVGKLTEHNEHLHEHVASLVKTAGRPVNQSLVQEVRVVHESSRSLMSTRSRVERGWPAVKRVGRENVAALQAWSEGKSKKFLPIVAAIVIDEVANDGKGRKAVAKTLEDAMGSFGMRAWCPHSGGLELWANKDNFGFAFKQLQCKIRWDAGHLGSSEFSVFHFGRMAVSIAWPGLIKTAIGFVSDMYNCFNGGGGFECAVMKVGETLLKVVPPFNMIYKMTETMTQFLEGFSRLAAETTKGIMKDNTASLIQEAAVADFPPAAESRKLYHSDRNLQIHVYQQPWAGAEPPRVLDRVRSAGEEDAARLLETADASNTTGRAIVEGEFPKFGKNPEAETEGVLSIAPADGQAYLKNLITQFGGREYDSSSCLAFAPQSRSGSGGKVREQDWQVVKNNNNFQGEFIKLEPWAVPCDNKWLIEKPAEWEGFSFYGVNSALEKCVVTSFHFSTNPVLAFMGGLEFDLWPSPLFACSLTICWPDKLPAGQQLSMIQFSMSFGSLPIMKHTVRLNKRFAPSTPFVAGNLKYGASASIVTELGISSTDDDDDKGFEKKERERLLQESEEQRPAEADAAPPPAELPAEPIAPPVEQPAELVATREELELSSVSFNREQGFHTTRRYEGDEAAEHLRHVMHLYEAEGKDNLPASLGQVQSNRTQGQSHRTRISYDVFDIDSKDIVDTHLFGFGLKGAVVDNKVVLTIKQNFGPFSLTHPITLIDMGVALDAVMSALPFLNSDTKNAAKKFLSDDLKDAKKKILPPPFHAELAAFNGLPATLYKFRMAMPGQSNSYTNTMISECNKFGMKPVCDHPHYCKDDKRALYIGQLHHVAHKPHRDTASYFPGGWAAVKDKWNGLCTFTAHHYNDAHTLCQQSNGHHQWFTMASFNPGFMCGKVEHFTARLGAFNGYPMPGIYTFKPVHTAATASYTQAMIDECNKHGMKPVCDHPSYCKTDDRTVYIGQLHHLAHKPHRDTASYFPSGWGAIKDQWNGLCTFTGHHYNDAHTLCQQSNGHHQWFTMASFNPGFMCGKLDRWEIAIPKIKVPKFKMPKFSLR